MDAGAGSGDAAGVEWEELPGLFPEFGEAGRWLPLLVRHAGLVEAAAPRVRVSSVPAGEVVRRHYAECLETWRIVLAAEPSPAGPLPHGKGRGWDEASDSSRSSLPGRVVDVGSGGGFPGLVIAAVAPEREVHLVEPLKKRAALLTSMVRDLGLNNVAVHALRAEEAGRGRLRDSAEVVTARAVAPLPELVEYLAPFAAEGGLMAMPKGSRAEAEVAGAGRALTELCCELAATVAMRAEITATGVVVLVRKSGATPAKYPRRPGMAGKRPL